MGLVAIIKKEICILCGSMKMSYVRKLNLFLLISLPLAATYLLYKSLFGYMLSFAPLVWLLSGLGIFFITVNKVMLKDYGAGIVLLCVSSIMFYISAYLYI